MADFLRIILLKCLAELVHSVDFVRNDYPLLEVIMLVVHNSDRSVTNMLLDLILKLGII